MLDMRDPPQDRRQSTRSRTTNLHHDRRAGDGWTWCQLKHRLPACAAAAVADPETGGGEGVLRSRVARGGASIPKTRAAVAVCHGTRIWKLHGSLSRPDTTGGEPHDSSETPELIGRDPDPTRSCPLWPIARHVLSASGSRARLAVP